VWACLVLNILVRLVYYNRNEEGNMLVKNFLLLFILSFSVAAYVIAATDDIPEVNIIPLSDLQQDALLSKSKKLPILIAFTADYCHYCEVIKDEFLKPMILSGDYTDKVLIREAEVNSYTNIRGFSGEQIGLDNLAVQYRATMTPTIILLGPEGELLAERLVGVTTVDFYGGYLDNAIDAALAQLRKTGKD